MSQTALKPVSRKSEIVIQEFNNEILIYDLTNHKAFSLNETSALVWQLCTGENSVSDIAQQLSQKFKSSMNQDFVWLALYQLKEDNLLEEIEGLADEPSDLSRREMIRKVGISSLISLPLITSLVAPLAANAASVTCSTAPPGGVQCRCLCSTARNDTCGGGLAVDPCNPGCTCTRTAISCYGGADPTLLNTAVGSCG